MATSVSQANYYDILGLTRLATAEDIRKAYRTLCRHYHPDTAPDGRGDPQRFSQLQEAYDVLSTPGHRRRYDRQQQQAETTARRRSVRNASARRPPQICCAACGKPVYASQLTLYLGRLVCQNCNGRRGSRPARNADVHREHRSPFMRVLAALDSPYTPIVAIAIAVAVACFQIFSPDDAPRLAPPPTRQTNVQPDSDPKVTPQLDSQHPDLPYIIHFQPDSVLTKESPRRFPESKIDGSGLAGPERPKPKKVLVEIPERPSDMREVVTHVGDH